MCVTCELALHEQSPIYAGIRCLSRMTNMREPRGVQARANAETLMATGVRHPARPGLTRREQAWIGNTFGNR